MEIKPSNSYSPIPPTETRATRRAAAEMGDAGEFTSTEALQRALQAAPDIRPEAVARGRELVKAETYPPSETLNRLARLFAVELGAPSPSAPQA